MTALQVAKGHGTGNDFVLLADLDGQFDLTADLVRALCDRHAGVGGDGVLRIVRSENHPEARGQDAPFFMDYRNADGSVAEMCGNGVRVFARWLARAGLIGAQTAVATRGGTRSVRIEEDGNISVGMGGVTMLEASPRVSVLSSSVRELRGRALELPNPHVVVDVDSLASLAGLDLSRPPVVEPPLPTGQNVEFVVRTGQHQLSMRVHERGVGETLSCGTGICAAVVAAVMSDGAGSGDGARWRVDVLGGTCWVTWSQEGALELCGPAVLVADLQLSTEWIAAAVG
jgi:diaminopimelate epimerase